MANLQVITGNLFTSKCQTLVNTVNCVGVMGAGLALECRLRYPEMFDQYVRLCESNKFDIGLLWVYKGNDRWILNFPTKKHWKYPTREEYLHAGLKKFMATYLDRHIESIAFPLLGAQNGGIDDRRSLEIMVSYLSECDIDVEIYQYDASAPDDLYDDFKKRFLSLTDQLIKSESGLGTAYIKRIKEALDDHSICQLNQLARVKGIGDKSLEKAFRFSRTQSIVEEKGQGDLLA